MDNLDFFKFKGRYRVESTRLKKYDYSCDGAYFVTICTKDRQHYFGEIVDGKLTKNAQARITMQCWLDLPNHYMNCVLDEFVIMPNHVHGIIFINNDDNVETGFKPVSTKIKKAKRCSLSEIIRGFKTFSARKINQYQNIKGEPFWQSRFYDHIIRNEKELNKIREYILNNPLKWEFDEDNLENK